MADRVLPPPPIWARRAEQPKWPYYDGFPRQYRVNQETGKFMRGTDDLGASLTLIIFDHHWETGAMGKGVERWGFGLQVWLDLAFIDEDGFASICSLKKDSATNVHSRLQDIYKAGAAPHCYRLTLSLRPVEAADGIYYVTQVADTRLVSEAEWTAVKAFRESDQFDFHLIGETTKGPHDELPA
jgi:hypothetical protein